MTRLEQALFEYGDIIGTVVLVLAFTGAILFGGGGL